MTPWRCDHHHAVDQRIWISHRLKARAERNHRSLQELMAILDEAARELTVEDLAALASRIGLRTPAESANFVRDDRDGRRR
jgi:hypothetical protein